MSTPEPPGLRVLVTGAAGRLGGRLAQLLTSRFRVTAGVHQAAAPRGLPSCRVDLRDARAVEDALDRVRPRAVLHCAALADADACERAPDDARRQNADACAILATACHARGVRLVSISTDLVFAGDRPFSRETDDAVPASVYGATKRAGEQAVIEHCADSAVARVALVSGAAHGAQPSASESIAWALLAGRRPRLFTDQYRTPVDPESVGDALVTLLHGDARGVFHLGGPERLSRFELGLRVAAILGQDPRQIEPVRQGDVPLLAPRPPDVSLDSSRARDLLAWLPRPVDDAIRAGRLRP